MTQPARLVPSPGDITAAAIARVKLIGAHRYAGDPYGCDNAVADDVLRQIIEATGLAQQMSDLYVLLRQALTNSRHTISCEVFPCTCYRSKIERQLRVTSGTVA